MELKDLNPKTAATVKANQWDKQCKDEATHQRLKTVKQIRPTMELLDSFESRRTELETKNKRPVRTIWAYYGSNKERIEGILKNGFAKTLSSAAIVLWEDPAIAIPFAEDHQLMLCRVALGIDGVDYDFDAASGKYSVKWPAQVMPTYMVYFE
eukprot:TRINITY_DN5278_c0_g1_i1.p1 TRINITY_DN5278_c0_g1~~TRINITY_DN5278_c0_g1_i1.p1  ORF type:complete len:153 (+),score=38.88 TRINITY_DN5278_c0_g1_i1:32-490(+)